jgi:hypothetical protein
MKDADVTTSHPTLPITASCDQRNIDSVGFVNAAAGELLRLRANVPSASAYTAQTDLGLGEQYNWFVRFCDQEVLPHQSYTQFTVGGLGAAPFT